MERLTKHGSNYCEKAGCYSNTPCDCLDKRTYNKLMEYEDAEEQGLLVRLPCKVGSNVYKLVDKCHPGNMECPFEGGYGIDRCHKEKDRYKFCGAYIEEVKFEISMIEELYKSIFIDRKGAEGALKGENNG